MTSLEPAAAANSLEPVDTALSPRIDFAALGERMHGAPGFPHIVIDDFLDAAFAEEVHNAFPTYTQARALGRTFDALNERHKTQITDASLFAPPIRRLHELLASPAFIARMSQMSGIDGLVADPLLSGGGIHETNHGGHLDVHVDFNFNDSLGLYRRLNILVYFNKDWQEDFGGYLDLWDEDVETCLARIAPRFNRAAAFATSAFSWHGVTPLRCPPGTVRKSFAAYYYTKEPPPGWDGVKRSTVFRPRPTEHWKGKVAMPAQSAYRRAVAGVEATLQKLRSVRPQRSE